uniref:Uncharacterized protein n=1 Tax=Helicotheca tamesis TaxID=374047 RepID=A0A7S2HH88_9STRA|mmetsp:Transcript_18115/g.24920  ORF Transcript_18115/g.24920 Transcript_18115/m.24920 type:complete len:205 (+) Transcript_18115:43-657(+)|eukprot:CAMPEP_0185728566 /NCGR_PEP_ID=MMETSP1171-20130828/3894_1 /TAXON_ID=374046 /ORGANISM="Helicotheca tamensis, Strain CCMP826" /LENGTH=204 /DNA_ID=CAMNT_0028397289 /DNA_START=19 /DNA_END=633 /DNA_ORIENTATION=+
MMKLAAIASLIAGAAAFAPAKVSQSSTALNAAWGDKIGAQAPLGYFDPLGLLKDADEETFERLRFLELKHGRVAQLAFLGNIVVLNGIRFPGYLSPSQDLAFADMPSHGLEALSKVPSEGIAQMVAFIFAMEIGTYSLLDKGEFKGDYTSVFDFGWNNYDDAWKEKKRAIEINNGRAAMMGITGLIVHEQIGNLDSMPIISLGH